MDSVLFLQMSSDDETEVVWYGRFDNPECRTEVDLLDLHQLGIELRPLSRPLGRLGLDEQTLIGAVLKSGNRLQAAEGLSSVAASNFAAQAT